MALLGCLSWIPYLWVHGVVDFFFVCKEEKFISNLFPDDVAMEILVRLPADDVMNCQRLCRPWESLTSTPYFIENHLKIATPSLFSQITHSDPVRFFICSEDGHKKFKYSEIDIFLPKKLNHYKPFVVGSCNGLLLFEARLETLKYFVINPITQEQVSFDPPPGKPGGKACAIYFHPSTRDYKVLYWQYRCSYHYQYCTYSLGTRTWKQISSFSSRPTTYGNYTIIMNGCLHWMGGQEIDERNNDTIMIYRIDKEDFRAMPHPGLICRSRRRQTIGWNPEKILSQMNERLTFCRMKLNSLLIEIWVLEDYENWVWVKRYELQLGGLRNRFHSHFCCKHINSEVCLEELYPKRIKLLGILNDELLFDWAGKGVFCYQIKLNHIKLVKTMGIFRIYEHTGLTVAYTKSLVSPVKM